MPLSFLIEPLFCFFLLLAFVTWFSAQNLQMVFHSTCRCWSEPNRFQYRIFFFIYIYITFYHPSFWWSNSGIVLVRLHLAFANCYNCEESKWDLCKRNLFMGFLWRWKWVFTRAPTVHAAWQIEEQQSRVFSTRYSGEKDSIIIFTFCNSQLWLMTNLISTCLLEYPQAKEPVKCQAKK